ncbi:MAG TPA: aminotransferase class IV [Planctomycetaceae bacterium]|nr:aminotransferase class IV [Planctomycetaceae bacterium]
MNEPIAWINGETVPVSQARLHVFDMGIVGGVSVAEMLRTFRHRLFRTDEHLARLQQSLMLTGLQPTIGIEEIARRLDEVVAHNTALAVHDDDLGAIVFVTAGLNATYVGRDVAQAAGCSVGIHTFPLPYRQWSTKYDAGVSLVVPAIKALPHDVVDPRIKSRSRMHWHMADQAARRIEPRATAILMDGTGQLTETAAANLIAMIDGALVSPPIGAALEGVSLGVTLELAAALGYRCERRPIKPTELAAASEAWVTSTPPCVLSVTRFNGQSIGTGQPGPLYRQILSAWSDHVGVDIRAQMQRGV